MEVVPFDVTPLTQSMSVGKLRDYRQCDGVQQCVHHLKAKRSDNDVDGRGRRVSAVQKGAELALLVHRFPS